MIKEIISIVFVVTLGFYIIYSCVKSAIWHVLNNGPSHTIKVDFPNGKNAVFNTKGEVIFGYYGCHFVDSETGRVLTVNGNYTVE